MTSTTMTPSEAARYARTLWGASQFHSSARKFLYYALCEDEDNPEALFVLTGYLDCYMQSERVLGVAEYAIARIQDGDKWKEGPLFVRNTMLFRLGLLTHISGQPSEVDPWEHPEQYILDEQKYRQVLDEIRGEHQDFKPLFIAARNFIGLHSRATHHKTLGEQVPKDQFDEYYHSDRFEPNEDYITFLADDMFRPDLVMENQEVEEVI